MDWSSKIRYDVPPLLEASQLKALERAARECFIALGCRDVARVDFRMDEQGKIYFLECNPLPGLTPGWSDLVLIAKAAGIEYNALISEILSGAIRRYKERERERRSEARAPSEARLASEPKLAIGFNGAQPSSPPPPITPEEPRLAPAIPAGT